MGEDGAIHEINDVKWYDEYDDVHIKVSTVVYN